MLYILILFIYQILVFVFFLFDYHMYQDIHMNNLFDLFWLIIKLIYITFNTLRFKKYNKIYHYFLGAAGAP